MELDYFNWCKDNGWTHFDTHFVYCNKPHLPPGIMKRGKKQPKSGNYYLTDDKNGQVIVRCLLNVRTHVFACRDCVWELYQNDRRKFRGEDTTESVDEFEYKAVRDRTRRR